ncbi:WD40 repeat-containing protein [Reticulomyxa filosa]|uniref:WD40 repeat-containing protein n=1 Tax=Reticulomyxa filosa TaxID=46433 RepID=X6MGC4_RETFI|nr:WD40 repeat-containing protein [Reticulomyxa filosa]|eukprot:ETO12721.1 WD40 repeat-containing protein [Reticulomyxa filosa]
MSAGTKQEFIEWKRIGKEQEKVQTSSSTTTDEKDEDVEMTDKSKVVEKEKPTSIDFKGRLVFSPDTAVLLHPLTFVMIAYQYQDENLGEAFVSGGSDGRALIWNKNGELLQELKGHSDSINSIDVTVDGLIVTGSFDGLSFFHTLYLITLYAIY